MKLGIEKPAWQIAFVVALVALLGTLATLQYRWLGQVSVGERERMHASLVTGAERFSQDFNREITRAFATFQIGAEEPGKDVSATIADRYDKWEKTASYPALVKEVFFIGFDPERKPVLRRFEPATRSLVNTEWPADLAKLKQLLSTETSTDEVPGESPSGFVDPVQSDIPMLLSPAIILPERKAAREVLTPNTRMEMMMPAYVAVRLDQRYINDHFFPELAERYFKGSNGLEYALNVVKADAPQEVVFQTADLVGKPTAPGGDASVGLFDLRMGEADTFRFTRARIPPEVGSGGAVIMTRSKSEAGTPAVVQKDKLPGDTSGHNVVVRIFNKEVNTGFTLRSAKPSEVGHWQLIARHRTGSLDTFIASTRRRNLIVSFGVLLLLAASMGLIMFAARRSQVLAQRQLEFVSSVSHEFRTPLAVICSAGENLADGIVHEPAQVANYGSLIRGEGRRLTEMVEQMMEFAGVQSGRKAYHFAETSVEGLIDDALSACDSLLKENNIMVEKTIAPNLPPVSVDPMALRQSLQNLIGNAIKYGAQAGWMGISASFKPGAESTVEIAVADHGLGIPPDDLAHVFEPFYRGAEVVAAQIHGNGLGLSLVQRVVAAHRGRVTVESAPGKGSVFTIHLPAGPATESEFAKPILVTADH
jgi:signal transduction histidine kinase